MSSNITSKTLKSELFEVITRLKEGNDPSADPRDCIDLDRAKAINETAKNIIDLYKVEVQACNTLARAMNPDRVQQAFNENGLLEANNRRQ